MPVNKDLGLVIFTDTMTEAWTFGPCPTTGPQNVDTGEEILALLAKVACYIPMQQARLQMMEIPEHIRTEQRKWLRDLEHKISAMGVEAGFHQHNLRKAGYGKSKV